MENNTTIKFYANYNSKQKKYFISGKNEKNKYFSLWKNPDFNNEIYLDTNKFKKGCEIEKTKLKLLAREDGEESKVLMFKNAEDEKEYCITKEQIEKRKQEQKNKKTGVDNSYCEFIVDLFKELFETNPDLKIGEMAKEQIERFNNKPDMEEITPPDELPF